MAASLRVRAVGMLVLLIIVATIGGSLAGESSYTLPYLAGHIGIAILLVGFSAHVMIAAFRTSGTTAKMGALIAFFSAVGATIAGSVFLLGGSSNYALDGMEGLTGVALIGIILLLIGGGETKTAQVVAPASAPP